MDYTSDIFDALDIQDELQTLYTSGTVFHAFLGERLPDWKSAASLVRKIAENYKLPYYTMSPTYSICQAHGYLDGEQAVCPICGERTEVYSRITGYYRPVQNWNDGKTQEFKERRLYDIEHSTLKRGAAMYRAGVNVTVSGTEDAERFGELESEKTAAGFSGASETEKTVAGLSGASEPEKMTAGISDRPESVDRVASVSLKSELETELDAVQAETNMQEVRYLFTTKTCPNCRIAKEMLKGEPYEVVEAEENQELVSQFGVMQAPTLIVLHNGEVDKYVNASNIKRYVDRLVSNA